MRFFDEKQVREVATQWENEARHGTAAAMVRTIPKIEEHRASERRLVKH